MSIQICSDLSESTELCERYDLYLKPWLRIKISVQLPTLKSPGKAISTWKVMEKLKTMIKPDEFVTLKVVKTNLVLIQFEGEVEKKESFKRVLQKVHSNTMKLEDFSEVLKIRAAEAKHVYPTRHEWDSFFRDSKHNEMKPGERPDTIYIKDLPVKWFSEHTKNPKPSEHVLKKVFETFGVVRQVAIPEAKEDDNFGKVNNFGMVQTFEAYVQFVEYIGFVKAMDSLKGMKLVYKSDSGKVYSTELKVDFDKSRHLSDKSIIQRKVQQKLASEKNQVQKDVKEKEPKAVQDECQKTADVIQKAPVDLNLPKKRIKLKEAEIKMATEIRKEEAMYLMKTLIRKAELTEIERLSIEKEEQIVQERVEQKKLMEKASEQERRRKEEEEKVRKNFLQQKEKVLREKLMKKLKDRERQRTEQLREKLRKEIAGRKKLRSVLATVPNSRRNHVKKSLKRLKSR